MAQPTPYTRQFNFTDFQSVSPDEPLPGNQVDAELNAVKTTADGVLQNLARIQRDDGELANQIANPETLSTSTLTLIGEFSFEGAWVTATAYAVKDLVTQSSNTYLCLVAHTSGTFATDLAANKWILLTKTGLAPDGTVTPSANLPMGGFKFTNLGNGSARTDSINLGQAQDMSIQWGAVSGTANAIVLTLTPAITTYVAGQTIKFKATASNNAATTVNWGGGVIAVRYNNAALAGGEIVSGRTYELTYDGSVAQLSSFIESTVPIANGGTGQTTEELAFAALKQAASDSATGVVELATLAEVKAGTAAVVPTADLLPQAMWVGRRNKLINGAFDVWQRGAGDAASFSTPASGTYTADRWAVEYDGTIGTFAISNVSNSQGVRGALQALTGSAPRNALRWNQTAAGSGQTSKKLRQRIENLKQFQGTKVRISFVGVSSSGTADVSVYTKYGYGTGGSPSSTEAGPTAGAFTFTTSRQRFEATLSIGSFSGKTFGTDGDHTSYLEFGFSLPLNATHDLSIADVQLEFGEATTPYDRQQFGDVLRDCQRYYWKTFPLGTAPAQNGGTTGSMNWASVGTTTASRSPEVQFPVFMRIAPTVTTYNPSAANAQVRNDTDSADCTLTAGAGSERGLIVTYTGSAATAANESMRVHATADAEL